jgi:Spy/CpxP family protein refolding chaperone
MALTVSARWVRGMGIAATLAAGTAMAGCGGGAASNAPASAPTSAQPAEQDEIAAGLSEMHRHHHHGGVTMLIALSVDTLGISPEQKSAVEKARAELRTSMEPARAAEQSLHAQLADGIAVGNIDQAKVDAALSQLTSAAAGVHDATIAALNELHAALTPAQRSALVDKVEAHWEVWQKANADEERSATGQPRREGHLARLAGELGLTQEQIDKIHATLAGGGKPQRLDPQEIASHLHAFGEAFRSDAFDAKALTTAGSADAHLAGAGAARMARFYEAVTPALTADQRAKLADILREHASYEPGAKGA